jgi:hypothetical protein
MTTRAPGPTIRCTRGVLSTYAHTVASAPLGAVTDRDLEP